MKIVFLLYSDLNCNSGYHVDIFASKLVGLGHEVMVVHAGNEELSEPLIYRTSSHADFSANTRRHLREFRPDIVCAWTPREVVRLLWEKICKVSSEKYKLVIHFEDNEVLLAEACQPEIIAAGSNLGFFDPEQGQGFIEQADAFTFVTDSLRDIVPVGERQYLTLGAPYDDRLFGQKPRNDGWRHEHGIADDSMVIVYAGNVHRVNREDVGFLYQAVESLAEHLSVKLVRTGMGMPVEGAEDYLVDLGFVSRRDLPEIMAAADLFVQPGRPGPFENYRFPSKIPEMMAIGRPIICPDLPCLSAFADREEVFKCEMNHSDDICEAVIEVTTTLGLVEKLSAGSAQAAERECHPKVKVDSLIEYYHQIMESNP